MTKELIFIASTSTFTVAFTVLLLWFAWDAVRAWRAKSKTKRIETAIDEDEYSTPDWEREIHRINRRCAEEMMDTQKVHVQIVNDLKRTHRRELNQTVADLRREHRDEMIDVHERRGKEESGADEPAQ